MLNETQGNQNYYNYGNSVVHNSFRFDPGAIRGLETVRVFSVSCITPSNLIFRTYQIPLLRRMLWYVKSNV